MGLFKKLSPAWKELHDVCFVLGSAIARCSTGEMPPEYLEFTIQQQAATFRANLEAYGNEIGDTDRAWSTAEINVNVTAEMSINAMHRYVDKQRLSKRVTDVLVATIAASVTETADNPGG